MTEISSIRGLEILDSRGRPTVKAFVELSNDITGAASAPSGASTGSAEAHELRDGNPGRYQGYGCQQAVAHIDTIISKSLAGKPLPDQHSLDQHLIDLDGTPNKSRLGANAILAVSLAYARALALHRQQPLYKYFQGLLPDAGPRLPRLTINLFSGGKHAGGQVPVQDVLMVPLSAGSVRESLEQANKVYQAGVALAFAKYKSRWLTADEGGLAPPFRKLHDMFADAVAAIEMAGLKPGVDVALALDVAASHFYENGIYDLGPVKREGKEMVKDLEAWVRDFPIVSLEDGLAEEDWSHWPVLKKAIGNCCLVLGDDLLCTNPQRIQRAIDEDAANALLLKVNQVGTLTEAARAFRLARDAGWQVTVSARSGETEDDWLADLAVGWGGQQIKVGSITQSERLAKYNRLLEIEKITELKMKGWE